MILLFKKIENSLYRGYENVRVPQNVRVPKNRPRIRDVSCWLLKPGKSLVSAGLSRGSALDVRGGSYGRRESTGGFSVFRLLLREGKRTEAACPRYVLSWLNPLRTWQRQLSDCLAATLSRVRQSSPTCARPARLLVPRILSVLSKVHY